MKLKTSISVVTLSLSAVLAGCAATGTEQPRASAAAEVRKNQSESEKANALFERIFLENVMASPVSQTYLGIKKDYDKWDEISEEADQKNLTRAQAHLDKLLEINAAKLDQQTRLSYDLLKQNLKNAIADHQWRFHSYPVNQMYGVHSTTPSFLINQHQITNVKDAQAYISRLNGIKQRFEQLETALKVRADKGVIAPEFVFNYVISDSENLIKGQPFTDGEDSVLWADFKKKVAKLNLEPAQEQTLSDDAKQALLANVGPAYTRFIAYTKTLRQQADTRDGAWKLPQGEAFYNNALARTTTTDMTAGEIHELGLSEVARIHDEMRQIMRKVDFKGNLQAFFKFMRDDDRFYYPDTEQGRQKYLTEATAFIDNMTGRLDEVFKIKPKAPLIVKRVEAFREKSAGKAFYNQPAPDGSRPGMYYANLYDMKAMPIYQMEALAYHEGNPGHHMQIAIAQELEGVPDFRKYGRYTAYVEGWGLYSEYFPKEMGLYEDPYSDFGRLAMELWRACRLVVDTGIHEKKWTREQGIEYYTSNTPNAVSDAVKMVERHIVMPSQATAYKIGMLKILELRNKAQKQLGDKFDIRDFHTLILKNGPLPLDVLELKVNDWVAETR